MSADNLVGIYMILIQLPWWASVLILWSITDGAMHFGRDRYEGLGYQIAYSAKFGDVALFGAVFIAITILQRGTVILPGWLMSNIHQSVVLTTCFLLGTFVSFKTTEVRSGEMMDIYHDVLIAPIILFFAITLLPVIYYGGTANEKFWTACFIFIWVILVVVDIKTERMNQRKWMERNLGLKLRGCDEDHYSRFLREQKVKHKR